MLHGYTSTISMPYRSSSSFRLSSYTRVLVARLFTSSTTVTQVSPRRRWYAKSATYWMARTVFPSGVLYASCSV